MEKLKSKINQILDSQSGVFSYLMAFFLVVAIFLVFSVSTKVYETVYMIEGVKDSVSRATISAVADNYYPMDLGLREGNTTVENTVLTDDVKGKLLDNVKGFVDEGDQLTRYESNGSDYMYRVGNLRVEYVNQSEKSVWGTKSKTTLIKTSYRLTIPIKFGINKETGKNITVIPVQFPIITLCEMMPTNEKSR